MKVLIQRVESAKVTVEHVDVAEIKEGLLLYVCFEVYDTELILNNAVEKICNLRIFEDKNQKMNISIMDIQEAKILSISQFTLSWDGNKGNRPSFDKSMAPKKAQSFYKIFNFALKQKNLNVSEGIFGADMKIQSTNDGPATFYLSF